MALFYVYVLKTNAGRVFYVGKGSGQRMFWHRRVLLHPLIKEYQRGVYRRMREFLAGASFVEEKVYETDDETQALLHEQTLIREYGFENLVNTQSHAFTGRKLKPEVGRLIADRLRGRKMPSEVRAKISVANKGKQVSSETRLKLSASISAAYGGVFAVEHRAKLSWAAKRRGPNLVAIAAMAAANRGKRKDMTVARFARSRTVYAIKSPAGEQVYAFSNGIVTLLKKFGLATSTFYRVLNTGESAGWSVSSAQF